MKIKQGKIMPHAEIGLGFYLLVVFVLFTYFSKGENLKNPYAYILPLAFIFIQFSKKTFYTEIENPTEFTKRYNLFGFIPIKSKGRFTDYDLFVIRPIKKQYTIYRSNFALGSTVENEYLALLGRNKKTHEMDEVCFGSKKELDQVISLHINVLDIKVYTGAPKKGYEYSPS